MTFSEVVAYLQCNTTSVAKPTNYDMDNPYKYLVVCQNNLGNICLEYITYDYSKNKWCSHTCIPFTEGIDWEISNVTSDNLFETIDMNGGLHLSK